MMQNSNTRRTHWSRRSGWALAGGAVALMLLALSPRPAQAAGVFLGAQADTLTVAPGATFTVEMRTLQPGAAFNAFDIGLLYDGSKLTFVPASPVSTQRGALMTSACAATFHRFSAQPDSLAITMVLLCSDVSVSGADVLYKLKFTAGTTPGWTRLRYGKNTQFFLGGTFVGMASQRDVVIKVGQPVLAVGDDAARPAPVLALLAPRPNPARSGQDLALDLVLRHDAEVTLELLDTLGRRVSARAAERFTAGPHRVAWAFDRLPPGRYLVRARQRSAAGNEAGASVTRSWIVLR